MPEKSPERLLSERPEVAAALAAGPFHVALRTAIDARGLGLDRIRHRLLTRRLDVSTTSLSYWQHGRTRPEHPKSLEAVTALEEILHLPQDSLRALLGPRRARGPRSLRVKQRRPESVLGGGDATRELADQLPATREHKLDVVTQEITVAVDADGRDASHRCSMLVRARTSRVDRHIAMFRGDPGCDVEAVKVESLRDCVVGRVVRHPREPVLLAEILFGVTLGHGDTHLFSFECVGGNTTRAHCFGQGFRYPVEHCTIQVRFDPRQVPRRVYSFAQSRLDLNRHETGDLPLSNWLTAQTSRSDVEPGAIGIGWDW